MDPTSARRRSDAGDRDRFHDPVKQVVGFHVEGMSPSPVPFSVLDDGRPAVGVGSPTPVIIPPSFQRQISKDVTSTWVAEQTAGMDKSVALEDSLMHPSTSLSTPVMYPSASTLQVGQQAGSLPAPLAPVVVAPSAPKPIMHPEKSESGHHGMQMYTASASSDASLASTTSESTQQTVSSDKLPAAPRLAPATAPGAPAALPLAAVPAPAVPKPAAAKPAATAAAAAAAAAAADSAGKPKLTRAERRDIQDKQRAAKAAAKDGGHEQQHSSGGSGNLAAAAAAADKPTKGSSRAGDAPKAPTQLSRATSASDGRSGPDSGSRSGAVAAVTAAAAAPAPAALALSKEKKKDRAVSLGSTELFAHLQQFRRVSVDNLLGLQASHIHPAILQLGLLYADGTVIGGNARCMAMLHAFCHVITDYVTPEGKSLARDLTTHLNLMINFLVECRPLSVSMGNAIKVLKLKISTMDVAKPEALAKVEIIDEIRHFITVRIVGADQLLVQKAVEKVDNGDVVLTYAYSHVVHATLLAAWAAGKRFRVIVADSRPELEGRNMLRRLVGAGVPCTYILINAASYIIREVTKVFLGAAAVLSNGAVISRAGAAAIAMTAAANSKPVMICCESYKFHERVQLDSITHNELGDPDSLATVAGRPEVTTLKGWRDQPRLGLLNLRYDTMPIDYVTLIVTEFGMIPPTSVPVILREYRQEL